MPLAGKGMLLTSMNIDAADEADFNRWYDREHLEERVAIEGFLEARRYVAHAANPKYLCLYSTATLDVLDSPAYRARLASPTDWSRQTMARFKDMLRVVARITISKGTGRGAALGVVRLQPVADGERVQFDGSVLHTVHGPRLRLLIIGGGQLSRYLASMALMLDYRVTVCEPRVEYHDGWDAVHGVELSTQMPDDLVLAMQLDAASAVVALTHDPKLDDLALMEALRTPAFYVGALGSRANNARRRERLLGFDVTAEQADRLHGPGGRRLGGLTPPEIALSVLAEMIAVRRGVDLRGSLADWSASTTACAVP